MDEMRTGLTHVSSRPAEPGNRIILGEILKMGHTYTRCRKLSATPCTPWWYAICTMPFSPCLLTGKWNILSTKTIKGPECLKAPNTSRRVIVDNVDIQQELKNGLSVT